MIGETWCFFADGISLLAVIWALVAMRVPLRKGLPIMGRSGINCEGLAYAYGFPPFRWLLGQVAFDSFPA